MTNLNILYEDNHIIVVEKKANTLSQGDITKDKDLLTIIKEYLKEKYQKPGNVYLGLVHRLDRPVGGIMVFAKTSKAASRLSKQIKENKFKKTYLAIVEGKTKDKDTLIDKLEKLPNGNTIITPQGKESILSYNTLAYSNTKNISLVKINLQTGRHHQIRVQFASRGHTLLGDNRYGKYPSKKDIALFAYQLEFLHPTTKKVMKFILLPTKKDYWTEFTVSNHV